MSSVLSSKYFKVHIFSLIVIIRTNSDLLICILEFTLGYLWINWVGLRSSGILHSVMTMQYSRGSKRCHDMVQYSRSAKNIMTLCDIPEVQRSVMTWCNIPEVQRISWHYNIPEVQRSVMTLQYSRGSKKCHDTAIFQRFKEVSWHGAIFQKCKEYHDTAIFQRFYIL